MDTHNHPAILFPYAGPAAADTQDVFLFMRPETNGIVGERAIMHTIRCCPEYATKDIKLVYMANIPSHTLVSNHIHERYYALKIHFATYGGRAFTPQMQQAFSAYFDTDFAAARVIGSFEALRTLSMKIEELFRLRVAQPDLCTLNGQTIKRYRGYFIVNYDMPALIHRYSLQYNIAVMCFRIRCSPDYFQSLTTVMRDHLIAEKAIAADSLVGSAFHYSRSPFEQLRDGMFFLLGTDAQPMPIASLSFGHYLQQHGIEMAALHPLIINPIVLITDEDGTQREVSLVVETRGQSYADAYRLLRQVVACSTINPLR